MGTWYYGRAECFVDREFDKTATETERYSCKSLVVVVIRRSICCSVTVRLTVTQRSHTIIDCVPKTSRIIDRVIRSAYCRLPLIAAHSWREKGRLLQVGRPTQNYGWVHDHNAFGPPGHENDGPKCRS